MTVTAIDPCIMDEDEIGALTVGLEYRVFKIDNKYIYIKDDGGFEHLFPVEEIYIYFK